MKLKPVAVGMGYDKFPHNGPERRHVVCAIIPGQHTFMHSVRQASLGSRQAETKDQETNSPCYSPVSGRGNCKIVQCNVWLLINPCDLVGINWKKFMIKL